MSKKLFDLHAYSVAQTLGNNENVIIGYAKTSIKRCKLHLGYRTITISIKEQSTRTKMVVDGFCCKKWR